MTEVWARALNIIGIVLLVVEVFELRDRLERFVDLLRRRVFRLAGSLLGLMDNFRSAISVPAFLGVFALLIVAAVLQQVGAPPAMVAVPAIPFIVLAFGVTATAIVLGNVTVWVLGAWGALWLLDQFPKGTIAGIGAACAIASLVLDYT